MGVPVRRERGAVSGLCAAAAGGAGAQAGHLGRGAAAGAEVEGGREGAAGGAGFQRGDRETGPVTFGGGRRRSVLSVIIRRGVRAARGSEAASGQGTDQGDAGGRRQWAHL